MKSANFLTIGLFFFMSTFFAVVFGYFWPTVLGVACAIVSLVLAVLEKEHEDKLKREAEEREEMRSLLIARRIDEGTSWDAKGEPWKGEKS